MKKLIYLLLAVTLWGCPWDEKTKNEPLVIMKERPELTRPLPKHKKFENYPFRSNFPKFMRPKVSLAYPGFVIGKLKLLEKNDEKKKPISIDIHAQENSFHFISVEYACDLISTYLQANDAYRNCNGIAFGGYIDSSSLLKRNYGVDTIPIIQFIPCYNIEANAEADLVFMATRPWYAVSDTDAGICNIVQTEGYLRSSAYFVYNYNAEHISPLDVHDFIYSMETSTVNNIRGVPVPYSKLEQYRNKFFEVFTYNTERTNSDLCTSFKCDELNALLHQKDEFGKKYDCAGIRFSLGIRHIQQILMPIK